MLQFSYRQSLNQRNVDDDDEGVEGAVEHVHQNSSSDEQASEDGEFTESDDEGEDSYRPGGYHRVTEGEVYGNGRYKV